MRRSSRRRTSRALRVGRGSISAPGFSARAYHGPNAAFRGRIAVHRGSGMVEFPSLAQLPRILREEGLPSGAAEQAFGRRRSSRLHANGEKLVYGQKRARLGHVTADGVARGVKRGSLVLLDSRIGAPIWGAIDTGGKLQSYTSNRELSLQGVFDRAKELKIPTQAVIQAFGHMMDPQERSETLARLSGTTLRRRRR